MSNYYRISGMLKIPYLRNNANSTAASVKQKNSVGYVIKSRLWGKFYYSRNLWTGREQLQHPALPAASIWVWRAPVCEPCLSPVAITSRQAPAVTQRQCWAAYPAVSTQPSASQPSTELCFSLQSWNRAPKGKQRNTEQVQKRVWACSFRG